MKMILYRKGFDSTWGGNASPFFPSPDNRMVSMPIPEEQHSLGVKYSKFHIDEDKIYFDI
ncbi:MAG: Nucleotide modification associated domain 3 [Clostridia bacterium]|jgi:hypothetical protein|nr:Nucleotide modification associated domain 3 [Clostridia bacterium]